MQLCGFIRLKQVETGGAPENAPINFEVRVTLWHSAKLQSTISA